MCVVVEVVVFYPACKKWPERFYHGRVVSVEGPALDYWDGERVLQRNTAVLFADIDGSKEVRAEC